VPFHENVPLQPEKGTLSHTWCPKRPPFQAEHPSIVHYREYPHPPPPGEEYRKENLLISFFSVN